MRLIAKLSANVESRAARISEETGADCGIGRMGAPWEEIILQGEYPLSGKNCYIILP